MCQLIERLVGVTAEAHIEEAVIARAGLTETCFPDDVEGGGPHSRLYESWFGMHDPPRDYSVFDMSWVGPAASLISTTADLNRFYAALLSGQVVSAQALAQMRETVPVISFEGTVIDYGLGLHRVEVPSAGTFWGHDGSVWGGGALSMCRDDGGRRFTVMINRQRWNRLGVGGRPTPHPIDTALDRFHRCAYGAPPR